MGIGVEHAVDEDLLQIGAEQLVGERRAVDSVHSTGLTAVIFGARDVIHRQDARRRVVVDRQRHDEALEVAELVREGHEVARLLAVIELREQRPAELLEHALRIDARSPR